MSETRYGVISDVHINPGILPMIIDALRKEKLDGLFLNGDIGEDQRMIAYTLHHGLSLGVETFVQPGSHETVADYIPALNHFIAKSNGRLVNCLETPKVERGHHLVFLPGSDFRAGGEFSLDLHEPSLQTGLYETSQGSNLYVTNIADLDKLVTDPARTLVVCHVPRKFDNPGTCVDFAYFAEKADGSLMPGTVVENQIRQALKQRRIDSPSVADIEEIAKQKGFTSKRENRGNIALRDAYLRLGVTKSVTGHFHEASHKANDLESRAVPEGVMTDNLFYNSGTADGGFAGVVVVDDIKIRYHNIKVV
ncbi:hypothetical protein J4423_03660 [Candidatus Pacearchaeota archaeon]|nr:hypothetical protein [Candidatus Pacearchaeota archaeon]